MDEVEYARREEIHATQCMPRLWRKSSAAATPASLLERFREAVLKLMMISAISKGSSVRTRREGPPGGSARQQHRLHPDSYQSEAVEDCIEFLKRSAEGAKTSSVSCEEALQVGFTSLQVM